MNETWRAWGLRLLALGISIGIWFNASVEDRLVPSERVVEAGVTYNRPRGFLIVSSVPTVNVRLQGSKKAIRRLSPFQVNVQVELSQRQQGSATISLDADNVLAPDGLEVLSIEPATIRVDLEREITQRVPVAPDLRGRPAPGMLAQEAEVFPSQVLVTGPATRVERLEALTTPPLNLEGRSTTLEETVAVLSPDPLIQVVQPARVTVRVPIQPPPEVREAPAAPKSPRKEKP